MEDLINVACEQALKKLTGTSKKKDKDVKKKSSSVKGTRSVAVVKKDTSKKVPCDAKPADFDEGVGEKEVHPEDEPEFDMKLLLIPKVCTTKLDHMGLFDHNLFNHVDGKELIDLIYMKSNLLRKDIVTFENNSKVASIVIDTSDDDDHNEDNDADNDDKNNKIMNDTENDIVSNDNKDDDDDIEFIENGKSEAKRVLLSSNSFKTTQTHNYNHFELLKNPDFRNSLKELNIDVNALVNTEIYSNDGEKSVQREQDTKDRKIQPCSSKGPSAISISGTSDHDSVISDTLITSPRNLHTDSKEIKINSERNRAVNLPNMIEVRRFNQNLLTAEVPPVQTTKKRLIQIPESSSVVPSIAGYAKIAPKPPTTLTDQSRVVNNKIKVPPLIMFPQHVVSAPNIRANNVPNHNVTYTVSKSNVQTISATVPIVSESEKAQNIQCTCATKQLVRTPNGNMVVKTTKCSLHNNIKTINTNENESAVMRDVHDNLRVTSEPTKDSMGVSRNIILPPEVKLLVLPTKEMVYIVDPNAAINVLSGGAALESSATLLDTRNRYIISFDGNSSQFNSAPIIPPPPPPLTTISPLKKSNKLTINDSNSQNEKRLCISLLESDSEDELLGFRSNDRQFNTSVVDNKPSESAAIPNLNMDQPTSTHETVPSDTGSNLRIRPIKINQLQHSNANNNLIPSNTPNLLVNNAAPNQMTIDLTDDVEKITKNPNTPISPNKNVVKEQTEKQMELKSLQKNSQSTSILIENQTKEPEVTSVSGDSVVEQNESLDKLDAKQYFKVILGHGNVQEQLNKINDKRNETKETDKLVDSQHDKLPSKIIKTRKRNSDSAKLTAKQQSPQISLLKPLDKKVKIGPKSRIGPKSKIIKMNEESDTNIEKQSTSGWVLLGL